MLRTEPVSSVMTRNPLSVQRTAAPSEVRALLQERAFHHVPVVDGEVVVGMLSSVDLAAFSLEAWGVDPQTMDAELDASFDLGRLMSHDVVSVGQDEPLHRATELLAEGHIHALPVVDGKRKLVGMLTSTDLLRYLYANG